MDAALKPLSGAERAYIELIDNGSYLKRLQAKACAVIDRELTRAKPNRDKLNAATKLIRYLGLGVETGQKDGGTTNNFFLSIRSESDAQRLFDLANKAAIPAGSGQRAITVGAVADSGPGEDGRTVVGAELHSDV